jgi:hypothetical protein
MRRLRAALQPAGPTRRIAALGFVAVIAVIVGILAMHSLSLEDNQTGAVTPGVSAMSPQAEPAAAIAPASPADTEGCDTLACTPGHAVSAIPCVLALLLTLSLLILADRSRWDEILAMLRRRLSVMPTPRGLALRAAPSLAALSISRT